MKYTRATERLTKDNEALLAFYGMPAEHWGRSIGSGFPRPRPICFNPEFSGRGKRPPNPDASVRASSPTRLGDYRRRFGLGSVSCSRVYTQQRARPMQQRGSTMTDRLRVDQDAEADQDSVVDVDVGGEGGFNVQVEQREHIGQRSMVDGDGDHTVRLDQDSAAGDLSSVDVEVADRPVAVDMRIRTSQRDEADQRADVDADDDGASDGGTGVEASIEHHLD
ncbi:hypothetical protein, partial [Methylobacterium frigidaeris]|uniref:hypothetical protein n=1 Tax=Methylobacterium frigidaeris TaxID=2038277 RepID=UPI0010557E86